MRAHVTDGAVDGGAGRDIDDAGARVALSHQARGRVRLGDDVTVLFHFVPAPPAAERPTLPDELRGGFVGQVEPVFTAVLLSSFLLHAALGLVVKLAEPPAPPQLEDLRRLASTLRPPPPPALTSAQQPAAPSSSSASATTAAEPGPAPAAPAPGDGRRGRGRAGTPGDGSDGSDRAGVRAAIGGKGLLVVFGADGNGAVRSVFGTRAGDTGPVSDDVGRALAETGAGGVDVARAGDAVARRPGSEGEGEGGDAGGAVGVGDLGPRRDERGRPDTGRKRATAVAVIDEIGDGDGDGGGGGGGGGGSIDKKAVAAAIKRRAEAFQACYDPLLKGNATARGKVVVDFTIGDGGRVGETRVVDDTLRSPEVARCVQATLRRIHFVAPRDGDVSVVSSFIFQPPG